MAKDIKQLATDLQRHQRELKSYLHSKAPKIVGTIGVHHFKENFEYQGFLNDGVVPWPDRKTDTGLDILRGQSGELENSIEYKAGGKQVSWGSDVVYASIHNRGGKTPAHVIKAKVGKALKFAGKDGDVMRRSVNHPGSEIPQRQFIGQSQELIDKIDDRVETDLNKIFNT